MASRKGNPENRQRTEPSNTLVFVGTAIDDLKAVPTLLKRDVRRALDDLARRGCQAADYALSGDPPWPHLCSLHIDDLRIVVSFPEEDVVAILKIAPHDPATDPYLEIAAELGIAVSTAARTKPPCCDDEGLPRIDPGLVDEVEASFKAMTRRERRDRGRR